MKEMEIGSFEAKNRLSALLDQAAKGQRIWITKRGKRVALLSAGLEESGASRKELREKFRAIRKRAKSGPESLKSLIEEGRR